MKLTIKPTTRFYEYYNRNRFDDILKNHVVTASEILELAKKDWAFHLALNEKEMGEYNPCNKSEGTFFDENLEYTERVKRATSYLEYINGTVYELKLN